MHSSTRRLKDLVIFAVLGSIMFVSHMSMMVIPNIHLNGLLVAAFTLTYRKRALIPIYVFVMVYGAEGVGALQGAGGHGEYPLWEAWIQCRINN